MCLGGGGSMRKLLAILVLLLFAVFSIAISAQNRDCRSNSGRPFLERAPHNLRVKPAPPQSFNPLDRNFVVKYYYDGRWHSQIPKSSRKQSEDFEDRESPVCEPGYVAFHGFDYDGVPSYEFVYGYCEIPGHFHGGLWYFGY